MGHNIQSDAFSLHERRPGTLIGLDVSTLDAGVFTQKTVALLARLDCQTPPSRSCGDQRLEDSQMCAAQLGGRVAAALCRLFVYLQYKDAFAQ